MSNPEENKGEAGRADSQDLRLLAVKQSAAVKLCLLVRRPALIALFQCLHGFFNLSTSCIFFNPGIAGETRGARNPPMGLRVSST
ncbi:unnamed protein product [Linum trigynum]|uniref:Uncharacterized protein n=1 Tax=Linum trigynum TaxID=586398 RepID=A0AAV2FWX4_9ROSI